MNAVEQEIRFLQHHLQQHTAPPEGLLFLNELAQTCPDGTEAGILRLDALFKKLRENGVTLDMLLAKQDGRNFILTVAGILIDHIACAADQVPEWFHFDKLKTHTNQPGLPELFANSIAAVFQETVCLPLSAVEHTLQHKQTFEEYCRDTAYLIRKAEKVDLLEDADTVCKNFLKKVRSGRLADSETAFYQEFQSVQFDYSLDSLEQADHALAAVKTRYRLGSDNYEKFIGRRDVQTFLMLLGCYTGMTAARLAQETVQWFNRRQMQPPLPESRFAYRIEHNQIMVLADGVCRLPVLTVSNFLFDLTDSYPKSCRRFASDILAANRGRIISYPQNISSDLKLPQDWAEAGTVSGQLAAWNMMDARNGGTVMPMSVKYDAASRQNTIIRHILKSADAVSVLHQNMEENPLKQPYAVLTEDAFANLPTGRTHAVSVMLRVYTEPKLDLKWLVPYRPAEDPRGFVIYPLANCQPDIPSDWLAALAKAFYEGAKSVISPAHNRDLWSVYAVGEQDVFAAQPPAAVETVTGFDRKTSKITLLRGRQSGADNVMLRHLDLSAAIGRLQPHQRSYLQIPVPAQFRRRELLDQIDAMPVLYQKGKTVWAAVVQTDSDLFSPEGEVLCTGEVVFDPSGEASVEELLEARAKLFALKNTKPKNPEARRYAEHLSDETGCLFRFPYPESLGGKPFVCSSVLLPRGHLPNGMLSLFILPIVCHPDTDGRIMLLPARFWPKAFYEDWLDEAAKLHGQSYDMMPVLQQREESGPDTRDNLQPPLNRLFPDHEQQILAWKKQKQKPQQQTVRQHTTAGLSDQIYFIEERPKPKSRPVFKLLFIAAALLYLGYQWSSPSQTRTAPAARQTAASDSRTAVPSAKKDTDAETDIPPMPLPQLLETIRQQMPYTFRKNPTLQAFDIQTDNGRITVSISAPAVISIETGQTLFCTDPLFETLLETPAPVTLVFHKNTGKQPHWYDIPVKAEKCRQP